MNGDNDQIVFILLDFDPKTVNPFSANSFNTGE